MSQRSGTTKLASTTRSLLRCEVSTNTAVSAAAAAGAWEGAWGLLAGMEQPGPTAVTFAAAITATEKARPAAAQRMAPARQARLHVTTIL